MYVLHNTYVQGQGQSFFETFDGFGGFDGPRGDCDERCPGGDFLGVTLGSRKVVYWRVYIYIYIHSSMIQHGLRFGWYLGTV